MTPAFERLTKTLKRLPGIGFRSAERLALHLLVEKPASLPELSEALRDAASRVRACPRCGNLSEDESCRVCADPTRDPTALCVVETVTDLAAIERAGAFRGRYHVLQGKLSPLRNIGPEQLNLKTLRPRLESGEVEELVLALSNDIEGEATCHYIQEELIAGLGLRITRIGFGLPSGGGIVFADAATLKNALEGRRDYQ